MTFYGRGAMLGAMMQSHVRTWPRVLGIAAILIGALTQSASAGKVMLDSAQIVKLVAPDNRTISSARAAVGDTVTLRVAVPVKMGGMTIIDSSASALAVITNVRKSATGGSPGHIGLKCVGLRPAGVYKSETGLIALNGSAEKSGSNTAVFSWLLGFGLWIKGGNATFTPGDTIIAHTAAPAVLEN